MATITISIGNVSTSKTMSDTDWKRTCDALRITFDKPDASDDEIFTIWADSVFHGLIVTVRMTPPGSPTDIVLT